MATHVASVLLHRQRVEELDSWTKSLKHLILASMVVSNRIKNCENQSIYARNLVTVVEDVQRVEAFLGSYTKDGGEAEMLQKNTEANMSPGSNAARPKSTVSVVSAVASNSQKTDNEDPSKGSNAARPKSSVVPAVAGNSQKEDNEDPPSDTLNGACAALGGNCQNEDDEDPSYATCDICGKAAHTKNCYNASTGKCMNCIFGKKRKKEQKEKKEPSLDDIPEDTIYLAARQQTAPGRMF